MKSGPQSARAVVFDLDGTLADTAPDIAAALNVALTDLGYPPLPLRDVKRMVGGGARLLVERAIAASGGASENQAVDRAYRVFLDAYAVTPSRYGTLYAGAAEELVTLKRRGWRIGVCTNKPHDLAAELIAAFGVAGNVDGLIGGSSRHRLKPAPDMLLALIDEIGVDTARAVMVGDSAADVGCARACGVVSIVFAHGYGDRPATQLGADMVRPGFDGLADVLEGIVAR